MKEKDNIITFTGHRYGTVKNSSDIWDHVSEDSKILDKEKIFVLLDRYFKVIPEKLEHFFDIFHDPMSDAQRLANMSDEGRQLMREWVERTYKKVLKEKPDSFFTKLQVKHFEKIKKDGKDPYDQWYRGSTKSFDGRLFFRVLLSLLRIL